MIEPKHISNIQISFVDVSSKEGAEYLPSEVEVQYCEGDKRIIQTVAGPFLQDFINNLAKSINAKNAS